MAIVKSLLFPSNVHYVRKCYVACISTMKYHEGMCLSLCGINLKMSTNNIK